MTIRDLCKSYGDNKVYENFNLDIEDGKITCVLGESGSGKTTLLNCIAGLTDYSGNITKAVYSYVFQSPRLVSNLTVKGNLKLVCKDGKKIEEMLKSLDIFDKSDDYPKKLSAGQAQRASIARAFLYPSDFILMDEPFASLDLKLKIKTMDLFKSIIRKDGRGALFVTHDVDEAAYLADRILVINRGKTVFDCAGCSESEFGRESEVRRSLIDALLE